jgi:heme/copper-type cytochrome/quinol oxidase subunit 3
MSASAPAATVVERPGAAGAPSTGKVGMWLFLATDAMGFGGLLTAYGVLRVRADVWPDPHQRLDIARTVLMTVTLLTSSMTMTMAVQAARVGRAWARRLWLAVTVALGLAFLGGQAAEYRHLLTAAQPMGLGTDEFASTFYVLTGFHGAHVAAGVLLLVALLVRRAAPARTLEVAALFWHFVDLAWIPIFSFVYLLPTA